MENLKPRRQSNLSTACSRPRLPSWTRSSEVHALGEGVTAGDADHQPEVGPDEAVLGGSGVGHGARQLAAGLAGVEALRRLVAGLDGAGQLRSSSAVRRGTLPISFRYRPIESLMSEGATVGAARAFPGRGVPDWHIESLSPGARYAPVSWSIVPAMILVSSTVRRPRSWSSTSRTTSPTRLVPSTFLAAERLWVSRTIRSAEARRARGQGGLHAGLAPPGHAAFRHRRRHVAGATACGARWGAAFHPDLVLAGEVVPQGHGRGRRLLRRSPCGTTTGTELPTRLVTVLLLCRRRDASSSWAWPPTTASWTPPSTPARLGFTTVVLDEAVAAVDLEPGDGDRALASLVDGGVLVR